MHGYNVHIPSQNLHNWSFSYKDRGTVQKPQPLVHGQAIIL
jgi:hypothetical protein